MGNTTKPDKKIPPPYAALKPDPGAKTHSDMGSWVKSKMEFNDSMGVRDLRTGSESGFNN